MIGLKPALLIVHADSGCNTFGPCNLSDEAAHYDFVCTSAGIPVHYCAEQFSNDGTIQSTLMKAIKRTMAGEFSRELGDKVHAAMKKLVLDGYHAGGPTPYGFKVL